MQQLWLQDGGRQDPDAPRPRTPLPAGALRLADLGSFSLPVLTKLSAEPVACLRRAQGDTRVWPAAGLSLALVTFLQAQPRDCVAPCVLLGKAQRLPGRLLAQRVPQAVADRRRQAWRQKAARQGHTLSRVRLALADWTGLVTQVPPEWLPRPEALGVMACRWQSELLFKLWKSHGQSDPSHSRHPWRILTEVYAKLLAMAVHHWLFLVSHGSRFDRRLFQAAQTVRSHALHLAVHFGSAAQLEEAIPTISRCLVAGCRINKSRSAPRTDQRHKALPSDTDPIRAFPSPSDLPTPAAMASANLG